MCWKEKRIVNVCTQKSRDFDVIDDIEYPETWIDDFLDYVSLPAKEFPIASKQFEQPIMDEEYFIKLCDTFRSPHIWTYENDWKLRKAIWHKSG